ncbi:MAG: hypothetical protein J1F42_13725 [Lachnospiraceae bacterium]|nr:hypothetical protein [Lachnospiraceae bacterium]
MDIKKSMLIKKISLYESFPEVPDNVHNTVLNTLENLRIIELTGGDTSIRYNKHYRHAAAIVAAIGIFAIVSITGYAAYRQMTALQIQQFTATLTSENISEYLELDESSVQISVPDENGMYEFTWEHGESYESLDRYDLKVGELFIMGYGFSDIGLGFEKRLDYVKTITLNEDGTVTFAIYVPMQD